MKLLSFLAACIVGLASTVHAQVPAQPADPNQAIPAQPVAPVILPAPPPSAGAPPDVTPLPAASGPTVAIIADGSLKAVLQELAQTWADDQAANPQMPITLTNAGTMRAKIESGTALDLALDADVGDTKAMTDAGFLLAAGQRSLARNTLIVYGRSPLIRDDDLDWFDLIGTEWKKVAVGNPDLTASGRVTRHALHSHDLDDDDHKSLYVNAANETTALQLVQRQQADAAFVYHTDIATVSFTGYEPYPIKSDDAPPIFYTGAVFRLAKNPVLARQFLDYISSEAARPIWTKYGFETD